MSNEENIFFKPPTVHKGHDITNPNNALWANHSNMTIYLHILHRLMPPKRLGKLTIFVKEAFEKEVFAGSTTDPHKPFGKLGLNKTIFWRIWSC